MNETQHDSIGGFFQVFTQSVTKTLSKNLDTDICDKIHFLMESLSAVQNIEKLKEEYKQAPYKNIEIADLRAFIADKLQQMIERNVSRTSFAQRLQEIIDRYNAGNATNESADN